MSSISIKPQNLPEKLIWYYIIYTYPMYLLGAQYNCATLLATFLTCYLLWKWWNQTENTPTLERINISVTSWVWLLAVVVIEIALVIGHLNFNLDASQIIRSSLNWYRNWGIFALFVLVGHLNIRTKLIYRAACILSYQSLFIVIISSLAAFFKF
ncbi:MAG: hypothetical protein HC908_12445 [Calothrix sp. SM1_7_51]|nr:hypothetical protein [Calothrix sp. SM1_7_51]